MIKRTSILILPVIFPVFLLAQDKIETDRPTETQSAETVAKGRFQGEVGFTKEQQNETDYTYTHPNAIFRYGLFNKLELGLRTTLEAEHLRSENTNSYGLQPLEVGLKGNLFENKDKSFLFSAYGMIAFPKAASKDHQLDKTHYRARLLFENELTDKIKLNYNLGRDWDEKEMQQDWLYSISPQFELSNKWQVVVEEYATFISNHHAEHYVDGGLIYDATNNLRFDINAGKGLSHTASKYFVTGGISFRL